ncbi:hypothetical protein WJ437_01405 [Ignavigranum ruoffiae]|uniref:hypothetical protein n=1 Tax=Ignavigranum ruoffiae TaxID=89093 RepID=UPI0023549567|nr:hypothetical protein [Ignavigranum ruoffiae]
MKKLLTVLTLFVLCIVSLGNLVAAQSSEIYQMQTEDAPIQELSRIDEVIYLTINSQSPQAYELILKLNNFTADTIGLPNPSTEAKDIRQNQIDLGIDYQTVKQQLDLNDNPNVYQLIDQLEQHTPGIYPKLNAEGQIVFLLSKAEWVEQDQVITIKLFEKDLLSLKRVDNQTLSYQDYPLIRQQ